MSWGTGQQRRKRGVIENQRSWGTNAKLAASEQYTVYAVCAVLRRDDDREALKTASSRAKSEGRECTLGSAGLHQ